MQPDGAKSWSFCMNTSKSTLFYGKFIWKSKTTAFTVFDNGLSKRYCPKAYSTQSSGFCEWKIKEDGFYMLGDKENNNPPRIHVWT